MKPKRPQRLLAGLLLLLMCGSAIALEAADERDIKTVYLYNFARFFVWPQEVFASADAPFLVCIYGTDDFGTAIDKLAGRAVHGHPLQIEYRRRGENLKQCHLAYIGASEALFLKQVLDSVDDQPVLTVSDMTDFAELGGMVGLVPVGKKLRFQINTDASRSAGLGTSAQLLKLASSVLDSRSRAQ